MKDLNTTKLDFHEIRNNLSRFLLNQEVLSEYNINGTVISTIVDLMAYVTHYNAVYANMALNEAFLDTALIRSSVVSHAKAINFFPKQYTSATVTVTMNIPVAGGTTEFDVPAGVTVVGTRDGVSYTFYSIATKLTNNVADVMIGDVIFVEGTPVIQAHTVDASQTLYKMASPKIDTSSLVVNVKPTEGSGQTDLYVLARNIVDITPTDLIYFLQERDDHVEIYFGDGIIGDKLDVDNYVTFQYNISAGANANDVGNFSLTADVGAVPQATVAISAANPSIGGSDRMTKEDIQYIAPKSWAAQNRAVAIPDYKAIILEEYGYLGDINVWGGEDNIPVRYGVVFVSVKPLDRPFLPQSLKDSIKNYTEQYNVTGIGVEVIDPDIIYLNEYVVVAYDPTQTSFSEGELKVEVQSLLATNIESSANKFSSTVVMSEILHTLFDDIPYIISIVGSFGLVKKFTPIVDATNYSIDFGNSVVEDSISSDTWTDTIDQFYIKDVAGEIHKYRNGVYYETVGSVDYTTGIISLIEFKPDIVANTVVSISADTAQDIVSSQNHNILFQNQITVTVDNDQ